MEKVFLWICGVLTGVVIAMIGGFIKHVSNTKKHPCKSDIVFKDVCKQKAGRIEDCIEGEIKLAQERYDILTKALDRLTDKIDNLR